MSLFPSLADFEATRQTLHLYANAVAALPRAHAAPHDKWWHISLRVTPTGLKTAEFRLPSGEAAWLEMDLTQHLVRLQTGYGGSRAWSMQEGLTGTQFGDQILAAAADLGLDGTYARGKFEDDAPRAYDPQQASAFFTALTGAQRIFGAHRAALTGRMGPLQLWPHGFDLAFEWYGTRVETAVEHGELQSFPSQLNLGFFPGGDPYFYSNPWPFAETLLEVALPAGARWHTEGWQGAMLPYAALVGDAQAAARLRGFARAVFDAASPTLMA